MAAALNNHNLTILAQIVGVAAVAVLVLLLGWVCLSQPDADEPEPEPEQDVPTEVLPGLPGPARTIRAVLSDFERRIAAEMTREQRIISDARARGLGATGELAAIAPSPMLAVTTNLAAVSSRLVDPPAPVQHDDLEVRPAPIRAEVISPEPVTLPVRHPTRLAIEAASAPAPTDAAAWRAVPGFASVDPWIFDSLAEARSTVDLSGPVVDIAFTDWALELDDGLDWTATGWTRDGVRELRERMAASARRELVSA